MVLSAIWIRQSRLVVCGRSRGVPSETETIQKTRRGSDFKALGSDVMVTWKVLDNRSVHPLSSLIKDELRRRNITLWGINVAFQDLIWILIIFYSEGWTVVFCSFIILEAQHSYVSVRESTQTLLNMVTLSLILALSDFTVAPQSIFALRL